LLTTGETGKASEKHIKRLKELLKNGTNKDNTELTSYFEGRELIDILEDFSSVRVNPEALLDTLPQLQPRYYSISSSLKQNPKKVPSQLQLFATIHSIDLEWEFAPLI